MLCTHCKKSITKNESCLYKHGHFHATCLEEKGVTKKAINTAWKKEQEYSKLEWEYDELIQYLMLQYDGYSPNFSRKITEIVLGGRKDCCKIHARELYDMFTNMKEYLSKKSAHIQDVEHKFYFDLVVVIGSYGKYLDWKRKNENVNKIELPSKVEIKCKIEEKKSLDIDDLLF